MSSIGLALAEAIREMKFEILSWTIDMQMVFPSFQYEIGEAK